MMRLQSLQRMGSRLLQITFSLSIFVACAQPKAPPRAFVIPNQIPVEGVTAMRFLPDGESLLFSRRHDDGCLLGRLNIATKNVSEERQLNFCPDRIEIARDGSRLVSGANESQVFDPAGNSLPALPDIRVLAISGKENQIVEQKEKLVWRRDSGEAVIGSKLRSPRYLSRSEGFVAIQASATGESLIKVTPDGIRPLSDEFRKIDSFDISPDDRELVLSADTGQSLDVGLLSSDGGEVQWVYPDPLPERGVTWAPRGNKVSYVVETTAGALLRTVHVPTSFQLTVDFPLSAITATAWEPNAEKFAVVSSALTRGPRIELLRYNGEDRQTLWAAPGDLRAEFDQVGNALLLQPAILRYEKRYPLVVWITEESPFQWNSARASLHRSGKVATAIARPGDAAALRKAVADRPWVDKSRVFVVYSEGGRDLNDFAGSTIIAPSAEMADQYEIRGNNPVEVRVPRREAAVIEAFAADFIRSQLPDE